VREDENGLIACTTIGCSEKFRDSRRFQEHIKTAHTTMSIADQPRELEPSSTDIDASVTDNQATTLDEADHSNVSMDDVPAQIQVHLHVTFLETSLLNILLRVRWILIFTLVMKFPLHSNKSWCNWYIQCNNRNITTSNIHYLHPLKMNQMFQVSCFPT
jgi:hypothetical protein